MGQEEKKNLMDRIPFDRAKNIRGLFSKKVLTLLVIALVVIAAGVTLIMKKGGFGKDQPKQDYEIAVQVRDQHNSDPVEDMRTSMKAGDVLVVQKAGHSWSNTEQVSYLILKMNLNDEEKAKLVEQEERKLSRKEIKARRPANYDDLPKEEKKRYEEMEEGRPQTETVRPRKYRIDLEKLGFSDPNVLLSGQPLLGKTYDWSIVEEK